PGHGRLLDERGPRLVPSFEALDIGQRVKYVLDRPNDDHALAQRQPDPELDVPSTAPTPAGREEENRARSRNVLDVIGCELREAGVVERQVGAAVFGDPARSHLVSDIAQ